MMSSPLSWWRPQIGEQEYINVKQVLDSGYLNDGEVTREFECKIASLLKVKYAVAVTNGTSALFLALVAAGVKPHDEVIVPDVTFIATANAVRLAGAQPVLVDIDPKTLNLDPEKIRAVLTSKTRAIVPVHVSGRAADMKAILAVAEQYGLTIIEDAAEAFMSQSEGRYLGTIGRAGCLSFSANKIITTGQGGAILTQDDELYQRLRELKDQGRPVPGTGGDDLHSSIGYNFKLTNLQAAVGLGQLESLSQRVKRLQEIYRQYQEELQGVKGVTLLGFKTESGESPQWVDALVDRRDELDRYLLGHGIHCRRFWFPLHTQKPYLQSDALFPQAVKLIPHALWLPSALNLTRNDISIISHHIRRFYGRG